MAEKGFLSSPSPKLCPTWRGCYAVSGSMAWRRPRSAAPPHRSKEFEAWPKPQRLFSPLSLRRAARRGLAIYFALVRRDLGRHRGVLHHHEPRALRHPARAPRAHVEPGARLGHRAPRAQGGLLRRLLPVRGAPHPAVVRAGPGPAPRRRDPRLRRRLADGPGRVCRAARAPSWWDWYPPPPGSRSTASSSRRARR